MLAMTDGELEDSHTVIQWLFPLKEKSQHSRSAPVLTDDDVDQTLSGVDEIVHLLDSYHRYLNFLGLEATTDEKGEVVVVEPAANAPFRFPQWLTKHNHNYLRITRVLKCLRIFGLENEATKLFDALKLIYKDAENAIGAVTFNFWKEAVGI